MLMAKRPKIMICSNTTRAKSLIQDVIALGHLSSEEALRAERKHDQHRTENEKVGERGRVHLTEGGEKGDEHSADHRAHQTADTTDDHHHKAERQDIAVGAGIETEKGAAQDTAQTGQGRTEEEHPREDLLDVDAKGVDHLEIVDARPDQGAEARAIEEIEQQEKDSDANGEHEEAVDGIDERTRGDGLRQLLRYGDGLRVATPDDQRHIAQDESDTEREQDLRKVPLDEAQEAALDEDTHQADGHAAGALPQEEVPAVLRHTEADIAAHQVHATVREVGDAHHAEDQGKAAGDQKEEGRQGQALEDLEQEERRIHRPSSVDRQP